MGWKVSMVIINEPNREGDAQLLQEIGFTNLVKIQDEVVDTALYPTKHKVYIGTYNSKIIIFDADIPFQLIEKTESPIEAKLKQLFPNSEICAIVLHSTVNHWGYTVIQNGKKVRARAGSADDGTYLEFGLPLQEEQELLSNSTLDGAGRRTYVFEDLPKDILSEDQVGENYVFAICNRYLGETLESANEEFLETTLAAYKYKSICIGGQDEATKRWWKFW